MVLINHLASFFLGKNRIKILDRRCFFVFLYPVEMGASLPGRGPNQSDVRVKNMVLINHLALCF